MLKKGFTRVIWDHHRLCAHSLGGITAAMDYINVGRLCRKVLVKLSSSTLAGVEVDIDIDPALQNRRQREANYVSF